MFDAHSAGYDTVLRWCKILSTLCFNFDFSKTRKLTLPGLLGDDTLWTIPDKAAETLEDLTMHQFRSTYALLLVVAYQ